MFRRLFSPASTTKRYALVAFGDTEGQLKQNGLWSSTLVVSALVEDTRPLKLVERMFHLLTFDSIPSQTESLQKPFSSHRFALKYLMRKYNAETMYVVYWNAKHDQTQLQSLYDGLSLQYVDAIAFAKKITRFPSYKLEKLIQMYGIATKQEHSSLVDTIEMMKVLQYLALDTYVVNSKSTDQVASLVLTKELYAKRSSLERLKMLIEHPEFLRGLIIKQESSSSLTSSLSVKEIGASKRPPAPKLIEFERASSFGADGYIYFTLDDISYKVKDDIHKRRQKGKDYYGCGLYIRGDDGLYKLIRDKTDKNNILEEYFRRRKNQSDGVADFFK